MTEQSFDSIWWEEIHGPRTVRSEIYKAFCDAKSVVLAGGTAPWAKKLQFLISADLEGNLSIHTEEIHDVNKIRNPGEYLLGKFGKTDDKNRYREGSDPSLPEYIKTKKILENKFIYISKLEGDNYKPWEAFINSFKSKKATDGIFLIETSLPVQSIKTTNRITVIDIVSKISFYDVLSFSMLLSSILEVGDIWKQYIAHITSLLYDKNVESLGEFYSNYLSGCVIKDIHNVLKDKINDDILFEKSIRTAQIQILFPMIEELRIEIIRRHRDKIEKFLQSSEHKNLLDKRIVDPFDAELGFLVYLSAVSKGAIFSRQISDIIYFLHERRNELAHIEYCDVSAIERIINLLKSYR